MPLDANKLGQDLARRWLGDGGGQPPGSPVEAGQLFSTVVAEWFAQALSAGFPCATAAARQPQLAGLSTAALSTASAQAAGAQLGLGLSAYLTGQAFGAGVALAPVATPAGVAALIATFSDTGATSRAQADRIAQACMTLVSSTMVQFPVPLPPAPIV